jgi:hypothetical protein
MKTETLFKKLEEKGYVFPNCLKWTADDIDLRLYQIGLESEIKLMSQTDKQMILTDFFEDFEDEICEFINQKLEEHLENIADYN